MNKIMMAMSGGVDSSVAAHLIKEAGYDAAGVTLRLFDKEGKCGSDNDIKDAANVAERLSMRHYVFDLREDFKNEVISRFIDAYEHCRTPNPCIDCNRYIKFGRLIEKSKQLGYDAVATGHYARVEKSGDRYLLKKGLDASKDQSYVLYSLSQDQLAHTLLPLGSMSKAQVRVIAEKNGFVNAHKRDSQDICFVPDGDYAAFIERYGGRTYPCGDFVDMQGNVLGEHKGLIRYTIGQRKGLGLALPQPMYVCSICPENNTVVLGLNDDLFSRELDAVNINLIACDRIDSPLRVQAKVRYSHSAQNATVWQTGDDSLHVEFDEPQRAITGGQALVLYDGDTVIGGGVITKE